MSDLYSMKYDADTGMFQLSGELSFDSVTAVMNEAKSLFANAETLNIDLHHISRSDSTGLALLLDWMRFAKASGKEILFYNMPEQMLSLANASGLDQILPLQLLPEVVNN